MSFDRPLLKSDVISILFKKGGLNSIVLKKQGRDLVFMDVSFKHTEFMPSQTSSKQGDIVISIISCYYLCVTSSEV